MKIFILFGLILIVILLEVRRELHSFKVVRYNIVVPGLKGVKKAVYLSDMHNHCYGNDNISLFDALINEAPDILLIGGDMLIGKDGVDYQPAFDFVKKLPALCPVYYANGNHEQRMKEIPENYTASYENYRGGLIQSGVRFLENESVTLEWSGRRIKITGLEIPLRCYTHFRRENMHVDEITERVGEKEEDVYEILLAHNPAYMKQYVQRRSNLVLSGHLHGGIARIPGVVGAISPSFELFPKYSGDIYYKDDTDIVVSKGLGTHTINVRFLNPAEVVVLQFSGE